MKTPIATALVAAAALGIAGGALAEGSAQAVTQSTAVTSPDVLTRTVVVRFDANSIQSQRDAEKLFFRIRRAAEEVCSLSARPLGQEIVEQNNCETRAVAKAVEDANVPALSRFYFGVKGHVEVGEPS
ncbi:MAG: UrcA family protein [Pseudomonadota bacterium]|jgi:UrcA family protein|nr:MAG: hypothetical protein DIU62_04130 [Pseudomonadota bacterium]